MRLLATVALLVMFGCGNLKSDERSLRGPRAVTFDVAQASNAAVLVVYGERLTRVATETQTLGDLRTALPAVHRIRRAGDRLDEHGCLGRQKPLSKRPEGTHDN